MKARKRLTPEQAERIGIKKIKPNEPGRKTARYMLDKDQLSRLHNKARILIFDIETAPLRAYVWGLWKQNINHDHILTDWFMLTWSAKWLFDDEVMNDKLTVEEAVNENDKRITKSLFALMNEADIVVAHNGDKFDLRRINTRFIINGLGRPSSYHSIDTLKHARKRFSISSNRLDYLGQFFGLGRKVETGGFKLWDRCMRGDKSALQEMSLYNDQDVLLLEDVYLHLRPYIQPHPNVGLYINDNVSRCPTCASDKISEVSEYMTTVNIYPEYKCVDCGSHFRGRKAIKKSDGINSSLPR